ncbi:hypothetical protein EDD16DRAFT_1721514 [Pisolithus croceorrhizus]|nr:hypothetical protein EDD16DRAFT_1721514 [Pisolithus croceorrhizus]KAI6106288.1 hypothetical protein EV401DRAFT_2078136 [Pisolithus croceorrhizus]
MATLSEPHAEDSVLSLCLMQIQHSSNRLPGRALEGDLCQVDVDMVNISQMSDEITHDANEKLGLLAEYCVLFLSQKSCFPPTTTVVFIEPLELSAPDTPGPLDGKKSALFLAHKSAIEKTIELMKSDIVEFDVNTWSQQSWQEHLQIATKWRDVAVETLHNTIYLMHGIHWSELLCLLYWDPAKYQVIKAMHNLFLGELQHHCCQVLHMNTEADGEEGGIPLHSLEEQQQQLDAAIAAV